MLLYFEQDLFLLLKYLVLSPKLKQIQHLYIHLKYYYKNHLFHNSYHLNPRPHLPDSSLNSSTTPSTRLNTVKLSLTAILKPSSPILLYSLSKEIASLGKVTVFEDKSKVDAKSSVVTVPLFILALVTTSAPNFVFVAAQLLMFVSSTEASLIDVVIVLVMATV